MILYDIIQLTAATVLQHRFVVITGIAGLLKYSSEILLLRLKSQTPFIVVYLAKDLYNVIRLLPDIHQSSDNTLKIVG